MRLAIIVAITVLLADQASKWIIDQVVMVPPRAIEVLPFFNLVLVYNEGISFGLLGGQSDLKTYLLTALALAVVVGLFVWLVRHPARDLALAVGLISGGALGNAWDRVSIGAVIDFLDFHVGGSHWPAFNIADSAIFCGVAVILISDILLARSRRANGTNGDNREKSETS